MDGIPESPDLAALISPVDLDARVVYFPVRHHSPACAWHARHLIRELKPDAVLLEGPRDATSLIPFLVHEHTRMPVALYATYVRNGPGSVPERHAAYYPFCDYSPELVAMRAAGDVGARVRFIDLTFPQMVKAAQQDREEPMRCLLEEPHYRHSLLLRAACLRSGARDADDLWDHLFEVNFLNVDTERFIGNVLAYCAMARHDCTPEVLDAEGTLRRERAMAYGIAEEVGRVVVIAGGFHIVALPSTRRELPPAVDVNKEDASVSLMRYGFEQLDRLNGYCSGMPAPGFYQRLWDCVSAGPDPERASRFAADLLVELGRDLRKTRGDVSAADELAALEHVQRLARLRGHGLPSREDVMDGVRSVYIKGADDVEGVAVLAAARKFLGGDRVGAVPDEAGHAPILADFHRMAERFRLKVDRVGTHEVVLDLYRKAQHREISRFLHQLRFLDVPFGEFVRGPDYVKGTDLHRIQEAWRYRWRPAAEARLVERSLYGPMVADAATGLLLEQFHVNEQAGQGRRADLAAELVVEAVRMGLHRHAGELLNRLGPLIGADAGFVTLVQAMGSLLLLSVSLEPLEAHRLAGIEDLAAMAYERACFVMPMLAGTPDDDTQAVLDAMNRLYGSVTTLGDSPERGQLRWSPLRDLLECPDGNSTISGAAAGLLFAEGKLAGTDLAARLVGHLIGGCADGTGFLVGLLATARSVLWEVPDVLSGVHELIRDLDDRGFVERLPALRLAFSSLTPRECHRVAGLVARRTGGRPIPLAYVRDFGAEDMLTAVEVNRRVTEVLREDGLGTEAE